MNDATFYYLAFAIEAAAVMAVAGVALITFVDYMGWWRKQ